MKTIFLPTYLFIFRVPMKETIAETFSAKMFKTFEFRRLRRATRKYRKPHGGPKTDTPYLRGNLR